MQRGQEGELRKDATLTFTNGRHVYIITAVTTKQLTTTIVTESTSTTSIVDVITRCRFSYDYCCSDCSNDVNVSTMGKG